MVCRCSQLLPGEEPLGEARDAPQTPDSYPDGTLR